ncbi:MAG: tetratricopeptide repeat-containing glycosyltransferase family protein [Acetobacter sp.]
MAPTTESEMQDTQAIPAAQADAGRLPDGDIDAAQADLLQAPTTQKLVQVCDPLFVKEQHLDALRLLLQVVSKNLEDTALCLVAAALIVKHTARHDIVVKLLRNVVLREPQNLEAAMWLADTLLVTGDVNASMQLFIDLINKYPEKRVNLCEHVSVSLMDAGYQLEALKILTYWLEQGPATGALMNNMACALIRLGKSEQAIEWYRRGMEIDPGMSALVIGHGFALLKSGRLGEGWAQSFRRELAAKNMPDWVLALPRMHLGDRVAGRKILVFQEQGFGDTLQFIRSVSFLHAQGAEVTVVVFRTLVRLLRMSFPDLNVIALEDIDETATYDCATPIPDLPYLAGVKTEQDIPAHVPYLRADAQDIARFATVLPPARPRIGLVWAGDRRLKSSDVLTDMRRSTSLADMGAALSPVDATLVNLQLGFPRSELARWDGQAVFDLMGDVRDFADTAAIMENLDLIISVDTSPVHLAGALGRPVWLVSRWDACWRWRDEGETSAWYPTMRIFRSQEKSFVPVLKKVGAALQQWVADWKKTEAGH